jgi:hypothetical protein
MSGRPPGLPRFDLLKLVVAREQYSQARLLEAGYLAYPSDMQQELQEFHPVGVAVPINRTLSGIISSL